MTFALILIALLLLGAAVAGMLSRNLIHSALLLVGVKFHARRSTPEVMSNNPSLCRKHTSA